MTLDQSYVEEGIALLEIARDAHRMFDSEEPMEKRRLLNFVVSNTTWSNGELRATFREPFGFLVKTAAEISVTRGRGGDFFVRAFRLAGELGFEPRFSESESDVLPLNYSPNCGGGRSAAETRNSMKLRGRRLAAEIARQI